MSANETRRAIVIGINEYKDINNIPKLKGAENDANEVYERLKNPNIGNFEIQIDHHLIGQYATCERIRKAISDVLWKTFSTDVVLFYFSGHGFVDGYGNGYIAPYDMIKDEPLVYGIKMQELNDIISTAIDKKSVIAILDCCYSGIATKGVDDKKIEDNLTVSGEGRIILASSGKDVLSREILDYKHKDEDTPHAHGIFTSYLIDGLDGKAADDDGIINIDNLEKYVESRMLAMGREKPKFSVNEGSQTDQIRIAHGLRYKEKVQELISNINNLINSGNLTALKLAISQLFNLSHFEPKNQEVNNIQRRIDECLERYKDPIIDWLNAFDEASIYEIDSSSPGQHARLFSLVNYLSFEELSRIDRSNSAIDKLNLCLLRALCDQIDTPTDLRSFITRYKSCFRKFPLLGPNIGFSKPTVKANGVS
jgi:hypothetical protein